MTKPNVTIQDLSTNEVIVREMNDDEFAIWQADQSRRAAEVVAEADKEAAKQAVLNKLSLTYDELQAVLN